MYWSSDQGRLLVGRGSASICTFQSVVVYVDGHCVGQKEDRRGPRCGLPLTDDETPREDPSALRSSSIEEVDLVSTLSRLLFSSIR